MQRAERRAASRGISALVVSRAPVGRGRTPRSAVSTMNPSAWSRVRPSRATSLVAYSRGALAGGTASKNGSGEARRSISSTSKPSRARSDATTQWAVRSLNRPSRVVLEMTWISTVSSLLPGRPARLDSLVGRGVQLVLCSASACSPGSARCPFARCGTTTRSGCSARRGWIRRTGYRGYSADQLVSWPYHRPEGTRASAGADQAAPRRCSPWRSSRACSCSARRAWKPNSTLTRTGR